MKTADEYADLAEAEIDRASMAMSSPSGDTHAALAQAWAILALAAQLEWRPRYVTSEPS